MEGVKNQTENIKIRNKSNLNLSEKYKTLTYSSLICFYGNGSCCGGMLSGILVNPSPE